MNTSFLDSDKLRSLPAYAIADTVNQQLALHACLVVTAPPGAGKSTFLPLTMLLGGLQVEGRILMLEPRRIAARAVAERMAELLGERVGHTVGYRVRFESRISAHTRIEVVTEGILTRMLIDDPTLEGVAMVIFDEFHERSIHSDVALALTREAQRIVRPDLRIVVMSATIDATAICRALTDDNGAAAPLVESEGRMFPVEIHHDVYEAGSTLADCPQRVAETVRRAIAETEGDILCFLPGEGEIRRCAELLAGLATQPADETEDSSLRKRARIVLAPLFGHLPLAEQRQAIAPSREGERKVVLATNIAETSLTIEGVRVVIDSGLHRQMVHDAATGLSRLETMRISLDMADQRTGRAGRVAPGVCYRLWTMATEHRMMPQRSAEILTADLSQMMLDVAAWGAERAEDLPWITPPPRPAITQASALLTRLGALDAKGHISDHGRRLSALPCHPRIAQMLLAAATPTERALATDIAALLEERDPLAQSEGDADLCSRIDLLRRNRRGLARTAHIAEQYRRLVHTAEDNASADSYTVGRLIASAYPERVAKAHSDGCGRFVLASGETVHIDQRDALAVHEWLAVASFNAASGRVFLAASLDAADLTPLISVKDNVSWDAKRSCIIARREQRVGSLIVGGRPLSDVPRDTIIEVIGEAAQKRGESMFDFAADAVTDLQQRVATVAKWHPELALPDLATPTVLRRIAEWLPFCLEQPTMDLKRLDLRAAMWSLLSYEQQQEVERLAPTHIMVPTGSRIRLEYRPAAECPVLRVRLQECFGMTDTPRLDDGRQPILMELLSPGFKPVQLTKDLRSFWTTTYFDVRKELRRRYPKHHWPDDPLNAAPVRK